MNLPADFEAGVKLVRVLADSGCPLGVYNCTYAWHTEYSKPGEVVSRGRLTNVVKSRFSYRKDTEPRPFTKSATFLTVKRT